MESRGGRVQFTLREMLVLFVVVALGMAVLLPFIQEAREKARRAQCINNMKSLGLAFYNFYDKYGHLPASSGVTRNADGSVAAVDGWSFHVYLLPYMDQQRLYDTLDVEGGKPLVEPMGPGTPHFDAAITPLSDLVCPCNPNPTFAGTGYVTNYKAMGATHVESLMVASPKPKMTLYDPDTPGRHPDGALFPGTELKFASFGKDGTAHTILAVETIDPSYGVWTVGEECTLVGLPSEQLDPGGEWAPQEYEQFNQTYYAPAGFNGRYGGDAPPEIKRLKTYLAYDFNIADPGPYVGSDPRNTYGPSSGHPGVVNHLLGDGTVRCVSKDVDFFFYMIRITRAGGDPTGPRVLDRW